MSFSEIPTLFILNSKVTSVTQNLKNKKHNRNKAFLQQSYGMVFFSSVAEVRQVINS